MSKDKRMDGERGIRDQQYDKAISQLVEARKMHACWDTWGEFYALTDANDGVYDLFRTARAWEVER